MVHPCGEASGSQGFVEDARPHGPHLAHDEVAGGFHVPLSCLGTQPPGRVHQPGGRHGMSVAVSTAAPLIPRWFVLADQRWDAVAFPDPDAETAQGLPTRLAAEFLGQGVLDGACGDAVAPHLPGFQHVCKLTCIQMGRTDDLAPQRAPLTREIVGDARALILDELPSDVGCLAHSRVSQAALDRAYLEVERRHIVDNYLSFMRSQ